MYTITINGNVILDKNKARISVLDRGFLYGDSVYEVTMTMKGVPVFLEEHLDRLENSARMIGLNIQCNRDQLKQDILHTLKAHGGTRHYIRFIVTRGEGEMNLNPEEGHSSNIIIIVKDLEKYPQDWYEKGVSIIVANTIRNPKKAVDPSIKSGNYLNNILALQEAKKKGAFDAIMLNNHGLVTEATTSNLWIVKNNIFFTPPLEVGILDGITRRTVFRICQKRGLKAREFNFTVEKMKSADECFLTSSTKEIVPVTTIDGHPVGNGSPGQKTKQLLDYYREYIASIS